jgi:hypothetical protein
LVSTGNGIVSAINHGSLVARVRSAGVPSSVSSYLLCGGTANMPGFYNENRGPSDGLVFLASCQDTTGFGGPTSVTEVVGDNHLMLGWDSAAVSQIRSWLG